MSKGPASGVPAGGPGQGPPRGYSWPPFAEGHELSTKHGAHSPRRVEPVAEQVAAELVAAAPWLDQDAYRPALLALARHEARIALLERWLAEHGLLDGEGRPQPAAEFLLKVERAAADARSRLGLDPSSRARLERDLAQATAARVDLELVREAGRKALAAHVEGAGWALEAGGDTQGQDERSGAQKAAAGAQDDREQDDHEQVEATG